MYKRNKKVKIKLTTTSDNIIRSVENHNKLLKIYPCVEILLVWQEYGCYHFMESWTVTEICKNKALCTVPTCSLSYESIFTIGTCVTIKECHIFPEFR